MKFKMEVIKIIMLEMKFLPSFPADRSLHIHTEPIPYNPTIISEDRKSKAVQNMKNADK